MTPPPQNRTEMHVIDSGAELYVGVAIVLSSRRSHHENKILEEKGSDIRSNESAHVFRVYCP